MAVKNFFVFFMVNTPLKLCYMKGFVWVENDCKENVNAIIFDFLRTLRIKL